MVMYDTVDTQHVVVIEVGQLKAYEPVANFIIRVW